MKTRTEYSTFDKVVMIIAILMATCAILYLLLSIAFQLPGGPRLARWLIKPDAAAWVQAVGSVGAILVAIYVADRQHRRESDRRTGEAQQRQHAHYNSAMELVSAVYLCASDIKVLGLKQARSRELTEARVKLDGYVAALTRVDHLQFDSYQIINGILAGEIQGRTLSTHLETVITELVGHGRLLYPFLVKCAEEAECKLSEAWDSMNEKALQISDARTK